MGRVWALCLVTGTGRGVRLMLGNALISAGLALVGGMAGALLAIVGLVAILEALFDVLLVGPLLGCPLDGPAICYGAPRSG